MTSTVIYIDQVMVTTYHYIPIIPSGGTKVKFKLWEESATNGTIGIQNNEGMRRQPPPGEVGGTKLLSHFH